MTWEELTTQEKTAYNSFMNLFRPVFGNWENIMRWADDLSTLWTNEIQAIHAQLDAGEDVPDATGYPNSSPISKADMTAALAALGAMRTAYHTAANTAHAITLVGPEKIHDPEGL